MPPAYVKPYVKRGKTDAADAEANRTRDLLVKQRTQSVNMMRGLLAEFDIDIPEGLEACPGNGAVGD